MERRAVVAVWPAMACLKYVLASVLTVFLLRISPCTSAVVQQGGWASLGTGSIGPREFAVMGAFYQAPTVSGTVGKRMLVLYGGDDGSTSKNDLWFYDVGKEAKIFLIYTKNLFSPRLLDCAEPSESSPCHDWPMWMRCRALALPPTLRFRYSCRTPKKRFRKHNFFREQEESRSGVDHLATPYTR